MVHTRTSGTVQRPVEERRRWAIWNIHLGQFRGKEERVSFTLSVFNSITTVQ